jgi:hypothetical protein
MMPQRLFFFAKEYCIAIFFDLEKAYDRLRPQRLLLKLRRLGILGNMYNFIVGLLHAKYISVKVGSELSDRRRLDIGVPQGSSISPTVFNIMLSDLPAGCLRGDNVSIFADDICIWRRGKNLELTSKQIQKHVNEISAWCDLNDFAMSAEKTKCMVFSHRRENKCSVRLNNNNIEIVESHKFLGVNFDSKLTWDKHIDSIVVRSKQRCNLLRCLSGTYWGADMHSLLMLYRTYIRPIIDYGCIIYQTASKSQLSKLDRIQAQALRICLGALRHTSTSAIQTVSGEEPLHVRRKYLSLCYYIKTMTKTNTKVNLNKTLYDN